jgi:hypothetical protein
MKRLLSALVLTTAAVAPAALADQLVLVSVQDNSIIEDPSGPYSAGAAQYFFAGRVGVNGGGTLRRGALRFDFSAIPAGSTITSVSLRMYCSAAGLTTQYPIALHRMLASWGEGPSVAFGGGGASAEPGDVTWTHRFYPSVFWTTPGGEYAATASASRNVGGIAYYSWSSTAGLVADVQQWVNTPATNFGWCVRGNETVLQSAKRFDSHESGAVNARPTLTVVYTPPVTNPFDLTGDGKVNAADLSALLNAWGTAGPGDFNATGTVDGGDISLLLNAWTG